MTDERSVTRWLRALEEGREDAAHELWSRYFPRLVEVARARLGASPKREADEEDVALSVLDSLYRGVMSGRLHLRDRNELWRMLMVLTRQKAVDQLRHQAALRRGGAGVGKATASEPSGEALGTLGGDGVPGDAEELVSDELAPELALMFQEECSRLLRLLRDDTLRQIALWRVEGHTTREIAERLEVTERTVERKLKLIREKWKSEIDR